MQRAAVERAAAARGDTITTWYSEKRTAKNLARPELERLRADAKAGRLNRLYLFKLDRLTRSGIRDTLEVIDELRRHGCEPVTVADGFDLAGPASEIVLAVMAWASMMERQAINERIAAARDRLEAAGERWGRPPRMSAAALKRAQALRDKGRTFREAVADATNEHSHRGGAEVIRYAPHSWACSAQALVQDLVADGRDPWFIQDTHEQDLVLAHAWVFQGVDAILSHRLP